MMTFIGLGLSLKTGILAEGLGQPFPNDTVVEMCRIHGTLVGLDGKPLGAIVGSVWNGITIGCSLNAATTNGSVIITKNTLKTNTNEFGFFEFIIVKGLTVTIESSYLGTSFPVVANQDAIDISAYF